MGAVIRYTYSAGNEETCAVGCSVVGETNAHTVSGELMRVGRAQDDISLESGIGNLKVQEKYTRLKSGTGK